MQIAGFLTPRLIYCLNVNETNDILTLCLVEMAGVNHLFPGNVQQESRTRNKPFLPLFLS